MRSIQSQLDGFRSKLNNNLNAEAILNKPVEEQVKSVQSILNKNKIPELRFWFGKHNGKLLETVAKEDPSYLQWLVNEAWFAEEQQPSYKKVVEAMRICGIQHEQ